MAQCGVKGSRAGLCPDPEATLAPGSFNTNLEGTAALPGAAWGTIITISDPAGKEVVSRMSWDGSCGLAVLKISRPS